MAPKPKKSVISRAFDTLRANWDTLLTIGFGIWATAYGFFGQGEVTTRLVASVTGLLALIAVSLIRDRSARDTLSGSTENLREEMKITHQSLREAVRETREVLLTPPTPSMVLKRRAEYASLEKTFGEAREIWLVGASLVTLIGSNRLLLEHAIRDRGTKIKVLLLDENSSALETAAFCLGTPEGEGYGLRVTPAQKLGSEILHATDDVRAIYKNTLGCVGSIELYKSNVYPNYTLVAIDPAHENGYLTVEHIGAKACERECPHLRLTRKDDPVWMEYYIRQANCLMENAIRVI